LEDFNYKNINMKERIIRAVAGSLVLVSIALSYLVSLNWLWLGVFVGLNLLQSSLTKFCPLEKILDAAGLKDNAANKPC
jgi:hypothetical protein